MAWSLSGQPCIMVVLRLVPDLWEEHTPDSPIIQTIATGSFSRRDMASEQTAFQRCEMYDLGEVKGFEFRRRQRRKQK